MDETKKSGDTASETKASESKASEATTSQDKLAAYDPEWPAQYGRLARRMGSVLGDKMLLFEHAGSTSVPGLVAKPIIDVVLAVSDSADEASLVPQLEAQGFVLRIREPDWYQHRVFKTSEVDGNLHVFSLGCEETDRMLAFRNWLRTHEGDRRQYDETKKELAARTWKYVQHYADAKAQVVEEILKRALGLKR